MDSKFCCLLEAPVWWLSNLPPSEQLFVHPWGGGGGVGERGDILKLLLSSSELDTVLVKKEDFQT